MDNDVSRLNQSYRIIYSWFIVSFFIGISVSAILACCNNALGAVLLPQYKHITVPIIITESGCRDSSAVCYSKFAKSNPIWCYIWLCSGTQRKNTWFWLSTKSRPSRKITSQAEIIYDVIYTIGSDGYRSDIKETEFDAFIYGGSFTFGEGLNDNETLAFYLHQNHGVRAKNVGVHGYGLHQALYNIEQGLTSQSLTGINILLTAPWHALRSACKPAYAGGTPKYEITPKGLKRVGVCDEQSFISRLLKNQA